jgi:hypothetical protein
VRADNNDITHHAAAPGSRSAAATYAGWFACLAEPTRVKLLHTVATATGEMTVGELT